MVSSSKLLIYGLEGYIQEQLTLIEYKNLDIEKVILILKKTVTNLKHKFSHQKRGANARFFTKADKTLTRLLEDLKCAKKARNLDDKIMFLNWAKLRIFDMRAPKPRAPSFDKAE